MSQVPFYDPAKTYYENYEQGPFGVFADNNTFENQSAPAHEFLGKKVHAPFGIPAGPLLNSAFVTAALRKGFDIPVYKTVRSGVHGSHQYPNVLPVDVSGDLTLELAQSGLVTKDDYSDPLSITNSFGVPSYDPDVWQPDVVKAVAAAGEGQLVGLSFQGTKWADATADGYVADWVKTAKLAAETKPGFLEANLSCPNEGTAALLCFDIDRVERIVKEARSAISDMPLFLKISFFEDQALLEQLVDRVGASVNGFSTINTIAAEVRTPDGMQALPGEGRLRSGVCGESIKWAGIDMVQRFKALREERGLMYLIVGVGGVVRPEDYHDYRAAGADVVMSATGAMWNPYLAEGIKSK